MDGDFLKWSAHLTGQPLFWFDSETVVFSDLPSTDSLCFRMTAKPWFVEWFSFHWASFCSLSIPGTIDDVLSSGKSGSFQRDLVELVVFYSSLWSFVIAPAIRGS